MASNAIVRLLFNTADFDKNIRRAKGEIGNFEKSITSMAGKIGPALSGFAAFAGISVAIGDVVRTSMEFEKSLSSLKSLTGVTTQELSFFKDEAIRLGSTTTQTASQVVDAFKLIGSQMPELLKNKEALSSVTESAIILAEAAEIDVPEAAKALTGALNQMGASSSQAAEYINILAAASQQGSADIPYLNKAIENAGGAASSVGVQFNELVAAIEAIAPKITDAGSAGTNLRNIFLTLESSADKNLRPSVVGLSQAVENLAAKHMNATEMTKMFGKESVTAALALVSEKDKFIELTDGITGTNTALEQQKINNDNLAGSIAALQSAWEGFILTLNNSSGMLQSVVGFLADIVDGARTAFSSLQALDESSYKSEGQKSFRSEKVQNAINDINELVKGGMSREDALNWEENLTRDLYKRADSLEEKKEAYEEAMAIYNERGGQWDKRAYEQSKEVYMLARNEKQIRDEILDYIEKERQKLKGVGDIQKELNKGATVGTGEKKGPTDLQLAAFNAEGWANEEVKGLHNKLRQAIESGDKIKIKNIEIDLDEAIDEAKLPDLSKKIKENEDFANSLSAIGNAFGSMSSMADGAAGSILSYFGNLMNSVAAAIPAIDALNAKKKEESVANTEAAVTGAASSVASIPFVGAALAVAAIASVLAALANIPKYATGGIVGGSSFFGDHMIARVNSGEMILNQSQQGKLFNMINNGGGSNHITVDGEARVSGKAMYITIRNYMKANNIKW
ncbi:MAG TPA: phage tail tape measure protein [Bacteroides sp.]|jgi:TP901 family phage tail tape measure protein|uniref:phage tail tape measure protein n=1 Tax=Phocaeicola vulgatus TaxID=821 RepID=UPI00095FDBBC|nr:phage tail tape measure protein [Phocaeicola vulgatus]OKZ13157.1 MAG: phage tail tape measure protein [Bacteroides oleiciplenus]UVX54142.1 MAG: minor tail protein [Bacteriophage sp.]DAH19106.1 MAG TPA: minor tail protein [Caudoviricetes sp.]HBJ20538.1 phage tail tape measure protein [Bacteroides sp.]RGT47484.1 phage tail tape measure protein [Phocaeicola vulgatus]